MKLIPAIVITAWFFILPGDLLCETGSPLKRNPDPIEKADKLGEEFQREGPWSRQAPQGGFYDVPQPRDYLATPGSQFPPDDAGSDMTQYPLCYNPYAGYYEYCYPRESSYFRSRLRTPGFRSWWRRGRSCPPGYHFIPEEGCYRN